MARVEFVEQRLNNWAMWKLRGGSILGYAGVDLSKAGQARDPYAEVPVPINDVEASETDDAVLRLPRDLLATVLEYYLGKGGLAEKCARLCCAKATLMARIERAQRVLADHFHAQIAKREAERLRVEALQRSSVR